MIKQPLEVPVHLAGNQEQIIGKLSFPDTDTSRTLLKCWAEGDFTLSKDTASFRINISNPTEETVIIPSASFVPVIRTDDADEFEDH